MSVPGPEMSRLLAAAAEMRATGKSWENIAARLHRAADTCRRWPRRFAVTWNELYRTAEQRQMAEARAEATSVLRTNLRLEDAKQKSDAAKALLAAAIRDRDRKQDKSSETSTTVIIRLSHEEIHDMRSTTDSPFQPETVA